MEENEHLELHFEEEDLSLWEIMRTYPLPVVVQCDTAHCPLPVDRSRFNFDLTQPLLLYRKRTIQKVTARNLHIDPQSGKYQEIGESLLIPEDYKGWFSVLKRNYHNGPIDDLVPHFQEVSEISDTSTETFLIGGEKKVQALQICTKENGHLVHQQRTLFPGDVLRKGKIYIGEKKRKSKILRKTKLVTEKYLMCTDDSDREILLPFDQKGLFYTLTTTSGNALRPVMQMSQIVAKKYPPCIARLVYGRIPNTPCSFSGTLRLDRADLEQSVIASTVVNKRNILLEIPTACDLKFRVAVTNESLIQHPGYKNALDLCNEKATIYMRHMKVCHTIEPDSHSIEIKFEVKKHVEAETAREISVDDSRSSIRTSCATSRMSSTDDDLPSTPGRGSDYFEMRSVKGESVCESVTQDSDDTSSSGNSHDYMKMDKNLQKSFIKIVVENNFMTVPVSDRSIRHSYESDPPDSPPPPPPNAAYGYPSKNDGVMAESNEPGRRPSTITFSESRHLYEDNLTYDIPRRTRRDSAPPELTHPTVTEDGHKMKQDFLRRPSTTAQLPKSYTLPSGLMNRLHETLIEDHETTDDTSQEEVDLIPEYNSDDEFGTPDYENLQGLVKIEDSSNGNYGRNDRPTLPARRPLNSNSQNLRFQDSSPAASTKVMQSLSPQNLNSSIGPIPELPRSRNSPRTSSVGPDLDVAAVSKEISKLAIPDLPGAKPRSTSPHAKPKRNLPRESKNNDEISTERDDESCKECTVEKVKDDMNCEVEQNFTIEREDKADGKECEESLRSLADDKESENTDEDLDEVEDDDDGKEGQTVTFFEEEQNELEFGCIPEDITVRTGSDRHSMYSDKSAAAISLDSGIVSRDPSVFGSKNSDLHARTSMEMESYDNWKALGFGNEEENDEKDSESSTGACASDKNRRSFSSENSEGISSDLNSSFSAEPSFESDDLNTSLFPGKEIHHDQPFIRSKFRRSRSRDSKDISKMTIDDLSREFRRLGIKAETIQSMKDENLNGTILLEKYASLESVKEMFPKAGLIEQQKISLYIQGCKY